MFNKEKFKEIRCLRKIQQKELAVLLGKSFRTINRWERGFNIPSEYNIKQLAYILKVRVSEISNLPDETDQLPYYYNSLNNLDKSTYDFETKTDLEKQKLLLDFQQRNEILKWENQEFRRTNNLYKYLLNSLQTLVYHKNSKMKFTFINDYFLAYFGILNFNEVIGQKNIDIWKYSNSWKELDLIETQVLKSGKGIENQEITIPKINGSKGYGLITIQPTYDTNSKIIGIVVSIVDITSEQIAKEKAYYLESVLDKVDHVIWIKKLEPYEHYIYINNAVKTMYKAHKSDFYCNTNEWKKYLFKEDQKRIIRDIKKNNQLSHRILLLDGTVKWVKHSTYSNEVNNEKIEFGVISDITLLMKNAELQEKLDINIQNMSVGLAIFDKKTYKFIYLNDAISKIFGYRFDSSYIKNNDFALNDMTHPDDRGMVDEIFEKDILDQVYEHRIIRPNGEVRWVQVSRKVNRFNNMDCRMIVIRDITDEKKKRMKLESNIKNAFAQGQTSIKKRYLNKLQDSLKTIDCDQKIKEQILTSFKDV